MSRRSRSRSRGAEPPPPPDIGPPHAGDQAGRAADGRETVDDISTGSMNPGPAAEETRGREFRSGARASLLHGEVAPANIPIHMCQDEILYLTRSAPHIHPSAAWDERVYLAGVGRRPSLTQPSSDGVILDLEAGAGITIDESHHGSPPPGAVGYWQRFTAARRRIWGVINTIFIATWNFVRSIRGLRLHQHQDMMEELGSVQDEFDRERDAIRRLHLDMIDIDPEELARYVDPARAPIVRAAMERDVQTESSSLFLGHLRGNSDTHTRDGREDSITQVNDNAELLVQGSYVPTPRDPVTGELALEYVPVRMAPNGTPFLVPDGDRGLTTAYFRRRTWRLIYAMYIRDLFSSAAFATIDDIVKVAWMRRVFDFIDPYPRFTWGRTEITAASASGSDPEMPGLQADSDTDAHSSQTESSSENDNGDAFAEAFRMMMQRGRGGGGPETEPAVATSIPHDMRRVGHNLTRNTGM